MTVIAVVVALAGGCASAPPDLQDARAARPTCGAEELGPDGVFGSGAVRRGEATTDPVLLRQTAPQYTREAMQAQIQGIVEIEAVVETDGTVGDARIVKSLDRRYGLDEAAMCAAKEWLFRPALLDGATVPAIVTLMLEFRLH